METEDFINTVKEYLSSIQSYFGEVFYGEKETLKKGKYYLLGLNPGNYPDGKNPYIESNTPFPRTIEEHISNFIVHQNIDEYYKKAFGKMFPNIEKLFSLLENQNFLKQVFCSNLVFIKTDTASELNKLRINLQTKNNIDLFETCWKVHELALSIVDPDVIFSIGNGVGKYSSPYSYFETNFNGKVLEGFPKECKHNPEKFNIKAAKVLFPKIGEKLVIGLPHFSHYYLTDEDLSIIKNIVNSNELL